MLLRYDTKCDDVNKEGAGDNGTTQVLPLGRREQVEIVR